MFKEALTTIDGKTADSYRIQLFVNTNTKRGRVLLDSWTCPTKEIAERKFSNLKSKYCRNQYSDYEVIMFKI